MKFQRIIKIMHIVLGVMLFGGMLPSSYLEYEYMHRLPRSPMPDIESIYPWNMHGAVVYMTRNQYIIYYSLLVAFVSGVAGIFIMQIIIRVFDGDDSHS
jgi:hypothetical protein